MSPSRPTRFSTASKSSWRRASGLAAPRTWEEVEAGAERPDALRQLDFEAVLKRVERDGDIFADLLGG